MKKSHGALLVVACLVPLGTLRAWEGGPAAGGGGGVVPLRLEITLARTDATRSVDERTYVLWFNTEDGPATLKTGVEMPVAVTTFEAAHPQGTPPTTNYQYRNVGVNLQCNAKPVGDGRYKLDLQFEQSSTQAAPRGPGGPNFRTAGGHFKLVLRDGQSSAADIATSAVGEGLRMQATLHVMD
jgi:hypothetical protein